MNEYAFLEPEPDENEMAVLAHNAAPLSVETETAFAIPRYEHRTWRMQLHRTFMWAASWGQTPVLVHQTKLAGKAA